MTIDGPRFGTRPRDVSHEWATAWETGFSDYWRSLVDAYRDRASRYYGDRVAGQPDAFPLFGPHRAVAICAISKIWIFVVAAQNDEVEARPYWENERLATWEVSSSLAPMPDDEVLVREVAQLDETYIFVHHWAPLNLVNHQSSRPYSGRIPAQYEAVDLVDQHAATATLTAKLSELLNRTKPSNQEALDKIAARLSESRSLPPDKRGYELEGVFEDLCKASGCRVERGRTHGGEQIDLFVHRPFRALFECRWRNEKAAPADLDVLFAKLIRRPPVVVGVFVSMAGYTSSAQERPLEFARDRAIVLLDATDVDELISGSVDVVSLIEERLDDLVRRYQSAHR